MISLEQIRQLDKKVAAAVQLIDELRRENNSLKEKLGTYQKRIDELEILISQFKEDQGEIEEGIVHALQQLEDLGFNSGENAVEEKVPIEETANTPQQQPVTQSSSYESPPDSSAESVPPVEPAADESQKGFQQEEEKAEDQGHSPNKTENSEDQDNSDAPEDSEENGPSTELDIF